MTFKTDREALDYLESMGWNTRGIFVVGMLLSPRPWEEMTPEEHEAMYYLCDEWDYTWDEMQNL